MRLHARQLIAGIALAVVVNAANAHELIVSAAASLTNAFTELARTFETAHPGNTVAINFGGSGQLLQQIDRGAPVDVFATADQETMNRARDKRLIRTESRVDFARNALVLIAPADSKLSISKLEDLRADRIKRIAVSNPASVPAGRYSRLALEDAGLWNDLKPKVINTQHVRQSLDYVARGEVDAGFVYATDASVMAGKVSVLLEVPTSIPITYPIAVVADTRHAELAHQFIAFVRSAPARAILERHGFTRP